MSAAGWVILVLCLLVVVLYLLLKRSNSRLKDALVGIENLAHKKRSQSVKYGKLSEQFMPFLEQYPYNPHYFRFLGTPIDGVQFTDDAVVLVEFKTAESQLSQKQRKIKQLVETGAVRFELHRMHLTYDEPLQVLEPRD